MIEHDLILKKFLKISFFLNCCRDKPARVSSWASLNKHRSRRTTRYQAVTLSTHCTLYRQQICAIIFLFSTLGAEIFLSCGHSCSSLSKQERLSSHVHCYCSSLVLNIYNLCMIVMFLIFISCYLLH